MRRTSMISTIVVELESTRVVTIGAADTVYVAFFSLFLKGSGTLIRKCHEITEQFLNHFLGIN
jgi:hypothetical protein